MRIYKKNNNFDIYIYTEVIYIILNILLFKTISED